MNESTKPKKLRNIYYLAVMPKGKTWYIFQYSQKTWSVTIIMLGYIELRSFTKSKEICTRTFILMYWMSTMLLLLFKLDFWSSWIGTISRRKYSLNDHPVQVNLCQKLSDQLSELTHNMTRDCSLTSQKNTSSEHVVYKYCFECQNKKKVCTQHVMNLYFSRIQWTISCYIVG